MAGSLVCDAVSDGKRVCVSCAGELPPYIGVGPRRKRCASCSPVNVRPASLKKEPKTYYQRRCVSCGLEFRTDNKHTVSCGRVCGMKLAHCSRSARVSAEKASTCPHCEVGFRQCAGNKKQRDAGYKQKYCSRKCLSASSVARSEALKEERKAAQKEAKERQLQPRKCVACGSQFAPRSARAEKCAPCRVVRVPKTTRPCEDCGDLVTGNAATRRCKPCARKASRQAHKAKHGSTKKHRQRARRFGVEYQPVNPIEVFERDGWTCHICGKRTPKARRGSYRSNAPELDHIVPMSLGGSHTKGNLACACRACNGAKGAAAFGQPSLLAVL